MATPIQVVLEARSYVNEFTKPAGRGGKKDFYEGRDQAFQLHRDRLVQQVRSLAASRSAFQRSSLVVASVELAADALAKSNRPSVLLDPATLPSVGTAKPAELLVQVTSAALDALANKIARAPVQLEMREKVDKKTGEIVHKKVVTALRSDVGAIDSISIWDASRKLTMSLEAMQRWFEVPGTPLGLVIRLFDFDNAEANRTAARELAMLTDLLAGQNVQSRLDSELHTPFGQSVLLAGERDSLKSPVGWNAKLAALLDILTASPIVRTIHAPARLSKSAKGAASTDGAVVRISKRKANSSHPLVGVIDGGIAPCLSSWVVHQDNFVRPKDADPEHGTHIGGLLVAGQQLNPAEVCAEPDGCDLVDLCLVPGTLVGDEAKLFNAYYGDNATFFDKLDEAVGKAKALTGVRVFNFSLNMDAPITGEDRYCYETQLLDKIAWKHDVVFVISAGNLLKGKHRTEWPRDDVEALSTFALISNDRIAAPAESVSNVSVSSLNPPNVVGFVPSVLAAYSRRVELPGFSGHLIDDGDALPRTRSG